MTSFQEQAIRLLKQIKAATGGGAGAVWGAITGTLSAQTDLNTALGLKQTAAQVQTIADAKVSDTAYDESTWNGVTTIAPSKNAVRDKIEAVVESIPAAPYLVYTALLTQSGTDAPVATVLQNTLGGTPAWTYTATGWYNAELIGGFPADRTTVAISFSEQPISPVVAFGYRSDDDNIRLKTFSAAGDQTSAIEGAFSKALFEIRLYPAP